MVSELPRTGVFCTTDVLFYPEDETVRHSCFVLEALMKICRTLVLCLCLSLGGLCSADEATVRTPEQIRAVVGGMVQKDVAWRTVQWRTCLIDGLRESQQTGKPVVLWIFIDRPIDDERC